MRDRVWVKNSRRSPSRPIHTGTECGLPSGSTVATWAKLRPSTSARRSSGSSAMRRSSQATTSTSSLRGPWTPSTRSSSMSEVADGPETSVIGRPARAASASRCDGVGHPGDDVAGLDHADVVVGHERQRAAPRARPAVEHDRAGLGDRERAAGQHPVELVERARRERRVVLDELDALDHAVGAEPPGGHGQPRRPALAADRGDRGRQVRAVDAADRRAGTRPRARRSGRRRPPRRGTARRRRGSARGTSTLRASARARRGRAPRTSARASLTACHQSRKVCSGGSGSSRIAVQPGSGEAGERPAAELARAAARAS